MWFIVGLLIGAVLMRAYKDVQISIHKTACDELASRLDDAKAMSEYYKHNLRLSKRRIVAQNQELQALSRALYGKGSKDKKVVLGVFDGGKNA